MISLSSVVGLLILGFFIWLWQAQTRAKEIAINAAKNACLQRDYQFLDGTTSFKKLALKKPEGQLAIQRTYSFEFFDGEFRLPARIVLLGYKIISIDFTEPANKIYKDNVIPFRKRES